MSTNFASVCVKTVSKKPRVMKLVTLDFGISKHAAVNVGIQNIAHQALGLTTSHAGKLTS